MRPQCGSPINTSDLGASREGVLINPSPDTHGARPPWPSPAYASQRGWLSGLSKIFPTPPSEGLFLGRKTLRHSETMSYSPLSLASRTPVLEVHLPSAVSMVPRPKSCQVWQGLLRLPHTDLAKKCPGRSGSTKQTLSVGSPYHWGPIACTTTYVWPTVLARNRVFKITGPRPPKSR